MIRVGSGLSGTSNPGKITGEESGKDSGKVEFKYGHTLFVMLAS